MAFPIKVFMNEQNQIVIRQNGVDVYLEPQTAHVTIDKVIELAAAFVKSSLVVNGDIVSTGSKARIRVKALNLGDIVK